MALAFKKGSFTAQTTSGSQSVTGVGLGVAGEAVLFFGTNQTAEGTADSQVMFVGMAVSSSSRGAMGIGNVDNVTTTSCGRSYSATACILQMTTGGGISRSADFVSWDGTDGNFTVSWSDAGTAIIVHYIILGGTDLTNSVVTEVNLNATAGDQSYAHGLGTTPGFGIWTTINHTAAAQVAHSTFALGWAVQGTSGSTKCGSISINASNGETMEANQDQMQVLASDRPLICMGNSVATVDIELDYPTTGNLFDGTNVTFNQVNAPTVNTDLMCLFLAGGQYDAGSFASRTTTGDDSFTVGFVPKGVLLMMARDNSTSNRTASINANMSFGAFSSTDGTQEGSVSVSSQDAIEPTRADQRTSTSKAITALAAGDPGALSGEADGTALGTTSTINWTNATPVSETILWAALGDAAAAGPALPIGWQPMMGVGR